MDRVGYTPVYATQYDDCFFHNSMTVLTFPWLILYQISQILFYRTSIKGFSPPPRICTSAAGHTSHESDTCSSSYQIAFNFFQTLNPL